MKSKTFISGEIVDSALKCFDSSNWSSAEYDRNSPSLVRLIFLGKFLEAFVLYDELEVLDCAGPGEYFGSGSDAYMRSRFENSGHLTSIWNTNEVNVHTDGRISDSVISIQEDWGFGWHHELLTQLEGSLSAEDNELDICTHYLDLKYCPEGQPYTLAGTKNEKKAQEILLKENRCVPALSEATYKKLSSSLQTDLTKLGVYGRQIQFFLPPIPAIIFNRAGEPRSIAKEAIELKNEMSLYRETMSRYSATIQDDSIPIGDSLRALSDFEDTIGSLFPRNNDSWVSRISEWRDMVDLGKVVDGVSNSDATSLTKLLLGKPLSYLATKFKTRHVSSLGDMSAEFLKISGYGRLLQDTFSTEFSTDQLKEVEETWQNQEIIMASKGKQGS